MFQQVYMQIISKLFLITTVNKKLSYCRWTTGSHYVSGNVIDYCKQYKYAI